MRHNNTAAEALAYMTECAMATVEYYESLSKPPKSRVERHRAIAQNGLDECRKFVSVVDAKRAGAPRVAEWLGKNNT